MPPPRFELGTACLLSMRSANPPPRQDIRWLGPPEPDLLNLKSETSRPPPLKMSPPQASSQPNTRNPKPETRDPKPETSNPKTETRDPKPETRDPKPEIPSPKP